jgi:membrane fusion protein (multidrug efflux system)
MNTNVISLDRQMPPPPLPEAKPLPAGEPEFKAVPSPDSPGRIRHSRLGLKQLAIVLSVIAVTAVGGKLAHDWWSTGRFIESTDDAYVGGDVTVISPKVAGFISQVAVADNQRVKAGDLLIKIDDRDYRAALARAEAIVASEAASIANLQAARHLDEALVTQAEADVTAADAEIARTREDQARYKDLLKTAAVSVQSFQKADAEYKRAAAAGEKSRAALAAAQRQLTVNDTQQQQARAALQQAEAERDLARLNLGYTELRAPIDGTVGNRSAREGSYAAAGSQLISIVPARGLWVDANFKESQLARIRSGLRARIKVDVLPGHTFRGHAASVAPATGAQFSVLPPETQPAISPKLSSASPFGSCSIRTIRCLSICAPAFR